MPGLMKMVMSNNTKVKVQGNKPMSSTPVPVPVSLPFIPQKNTQAPNRNLVSPMIRRIHNKKGGCSACGKKVM